MKYRAEIDGLRAFAVLPVILFHAEFNLFSGGFIGVDIFFVISGYLITTILIKELEKNTFSIVDFYERRARRILPALFFIMTLSAFLANKWMMPNQLKDFSESLVAVSLFSSNILFYIESGYFDISSEEKPLLHTWTLAVEEQYYIIFPILLMLLWRSGRNKAFSIVCILTLISLITSEIGWRRFPDANFYMAYTRAWELLVGSITAFLVARNGIKKSNTLSSIGLFSIIFSIFCFDENVPFPSFYTLVPVIGTSLIVRYAEPTTYTARLLSLKPFVTIGLISYSAYLWHQPLFAFSRIRTIDHITNLEYYILILLTFILSYFTWKYIEKPFRKKEKIKRDTIFKFSITGLCLFICIGAYGHLNPDNKNFEISNFSDWKDDNECFLDEKSISTKNIKNGINTCITGKNGYILIGDSHAEAISKELRKEFNRKGIQLLTLVTHGCLPLPRTLKEGRIPNCDNAKEEIHKIIRDTDIPLIFSARWRLYIDGDRYDNKEGGIEKGKSSKEIFENNDIEIKDYIDNYVTKLSKNREVIIIDQIPEAGWNVAERQAKIKRYEPLKANEDISTSYKVYKKSNENVIYLMSKLEYKKNIKVIKPAEVVCNLSMRNRCLNTINGNLLYRDDNHPSPIFSQLIAEKIINNIAL